MASAVENFSDKKSSFRHVDRCLQCKRHSKPLERTRSTTASRNSTSWLQNFVECRHFVRLWCGPAGRRKAGVTKMAASVIGATRWRCLLVASNHCSPPLIRAPARQSDVPVPVSRFFIYYAR